MPDDPEINPDALEDLADLESSAFMHSVSSDPHQAHGVVSRMRLQLRLLMEWPKDWGKSFFAEVFGSFTLTKAITFKRLGVRIDGAQEFGRSNFGANWFYPAHVLVKTRNLAGFLDGIGRLEKALGALHLGSLKINTNRGPGCAIHYRCRLLEDVDNGSLSITWADQKANGVVADIESCPVKVQELLWRAIWWIRHARGERTSGHHQPALFLIYLAYWNALECVVRAINLKSPAASLTAEERNTGIRAILLPLGDQITVIDVQRCRPFLDPGLRPQVEHALRYAEGVLPSLNAKSAIEALYTRKDHRLAAIRNDIDHGSIVEYDLTTRERVLRGLSELSDIVLQMLNAAAIGPSGPSPSMS
jgi:hypothetical protein